MDIALTGVLAGLAGFSGVGLGAFGAHALKKRLVANGRLDVWQTAVQYHLLHAVALLGCYAAMKSSPTLDGSMKWATRFFASGILLFSGSLYGLALGGPKILGPITPLGGLLFMAGWGSVGYSAYTQ
eukprot:TRINITY_DN77244_c0_g1_i1.p1 TRINITY_DN77244_c0_g1~~TRINITY_DN77244_c0_g1_i1.p1  ORF type:complete len:127 (+),score=1.06 TRINITY_DN77244_c0_g1_i1:28-408(+)